MLSLSKRGQMRVGDLSDFAIGLLAVAIVVIIALLIIDSFQTLSNQMGQLNPQLNSLISDLTIPFIILGSFGIPVVVLILFIVGILIIVVILILSLRPGYIREEARD